MGNPNFIHEGGGALADSLIGPDGTPYSKAAGRRVLSTGGFDASASHLVDQPNYLASPFPVVASAGTGTLGAATYFYRVSAISAVGETIPSAEIGLTALASTGVVLTWAQVPGATGYKVYGRSTGAEQLLTTVAGGSVTTFHDDGTFSPSGAMPTVNTALDVRTVLASITASTGPTTGTHSDVAGAAIDTLILAANASRRGATITNDSSALLYLKLGTGAASVSSYSASLAGAAGAPFSYYEVPFGYTGEIRGIWASAAGNARVTELT